MEITTQKLVGLLIAQPISDRDHGFNDAIIKLLKDSMGETETEKMKRTMPLIYPKLSMYDINEIIQSKEEGKKLNAVKMVKDSTGLSIVEAKNYLDIYFAA